MRLDLAEAGLHTTQGNHHAAICTGPLIAFYYQIETQLLTGSFLQPEKEGSQLGMSSQLGLNNLQLFRVISLSLSLSLSFSTHRCEFVQIYLGVALILTSHQEVICSS